MTRWLESASTNARRAWIFGCWYRVHGRKVTPQWGKGFHA